LDCIQQQIGLELCCHHISFLSVTTQVSKNRTAPNLNSTENVEQPCHYIGFSRWCMTIKLAHFSDILHHTNRNIMHFGDRSGPIWRLASCKTTATTWLFKL